MKINCEKTFLDAMRAIARQDDRIANILLAALQDGYSCAFFNKKYPSYIAIDSMNSKSCKDVSYVDVSFDEQVVENPYTNKRRRKTKIGRLIRKLFTEDSITDFGIRDSEIERFVNIYASLFTQEDEDLKIYSGADISWAYLSDNYNSDYGDGGSLWSSCMRYHEKNDFFSIYEDNKSCKLLVLLKDGLVIGRALLWDFIDVDTKEHLKVMDRIYTCKDFDSFKFIRWAADNEYYYKYEQSYTCQQFINPKTNIAEEKKFAIPISKTDCYRYPYMDTFYYLDEDSGVLSNDSKYGDDSLRCEDGGTDKKVIDICDEDTLINREGRDTICIEEEGYTHIDNTVMSHLEGERLLDSRAIWCEYHDDYISEGNSIYSEYLGYDIYSPQSVHSLRLNSYLVEEESVYLSYCNDYMPEDLTTHSDIDGDIVEEDAVKSKYHDCMILAENSYEIDGDFIHKNHVVYSHYEDKQMITALSSYIMGTGWVSKEKESEARKNGLPIEADNKTEYEMRLIGNES
tara:strand:- start:43888 stop:45429 length:1542 start_codon:yes stop_codon:yes gene_type:complete